MAGCPTNVVKTLSGACSQISIHEKKEHTKDQKKWRGFTPLPQGFVCAGESSGS